METKKARLYGAYGMLVILFIFSVLSLISLSQTTTISNVTIASDKDSYYCYPSCTAFVNVTSYNSSFDGTYNITVYNHDSLTYSNYSISIWNGSSWEPFNGTNFGFYYGVTLQFMVTISLSSPDAGKWNFTIEISNGFNSTNFTLDPYVDSIALESPPDNSVLSIPSPDFRFNVTMSNDTSQYCELRIDDQPEMFNSSVQANTSSVFHLNYTLVPGQHNWSVACNNSFGEQGFSVTWAFNISPPPPNISVVKFSPSQNVQAGENVNFTINVTNEGLSNVSNLSVYDLFNTSLLSFISSNPPPDADNSSTGTLMWSILNLGPGAYFVATATFNATSAGISVNNATVKDSLSAVLASDSAMINITNSSLAPLPNVSVSKQPNMTLAQINDLVLYAINVTNNDMVNLTNISVTDFFNTSELSFNSSVPAPDFINASGGEVLWQVNMTSNSSLQISANFLVVGGNGQVQNHVETEDNSGNILSYANASVNISSSPPPPLSVFISKTANESLAGVGSPISYNITVLNNETFNLSGLLVTDRFSPAELNFTSSVPAPDFVNASGGEIGWNISVSANSSLVITANFTVIGGANVINNTADVENSSGAVLDSTIAFVNLTSSPPSPSVSVHLTFPGNGSTFDGMSDFQFDVTLQSGNANCTLNVTNSSWWSAEYVDNASASTNVSFNYSQLQNSTWYNWSVSCVWNVNSSESGASTVWTFLWNETPVGSPPVVSNVSSSASNESAVITWNTDDIANSSVEFGTNMSLGSSSSNSSTSTSHWVKLTGLSPATLYYYNVTSCNLDGYCATNGTYNFTTSSNPDTSAPVITLLSPLNASNLSYSTSLVTLNISTSEDANCTYNLSGFSNSSIMKVTGSTLHLQNLSVSSGNSYTVYYNCTDAAGNSGYEVHSFSVDAAPDLSAPAIFNVSNSSITNSSAVISWNTDEASNSTLRYGASLSMSSSVFNSSFVLFRSFTLSGLLSSTLYYYNVTSCDSSGNCNTTGPYNFTTLATNTSGPVISSVKNLSVTNSSAVIVVTTDSPSNLSVSYGTTLSLSSSSSNSSFSTSARVYLKSLSDWATYYYNVTSCRAGGYCTTDGPYNFTTLYTDTPPVISSLSPPNSTVFQSQNITLNCTAYDDLNLTSVSLYINGILNQTNSSPANNSVTSFSVLNLAESTYSWLCSAQDNSSQSANSSVLYFTVALPDTTPPVIHSAVLSDDYVQNNTNVTITVNVTDDSSVSSVSVISSSGTFPLSLSASLWTGTLTLAAPSGNVTVNATDNSSNSAYYNVSYTIDDSSPVVNSISSNDSVVKSSDVLFFQVNVSGESNSTLESVVLENSSLDYNETSSLWEGYSRVSSDGIVNVVATDKAGNVGYGNSTITIDDSSPNVSVTFPAQNSSVAVTNTSVNYTVTDSSLIHSIVVIVDGVSYVVSNSSDHILVNLSFPGKHLVTVKAWDEAGNLGEDSSWFYTTVPLNASDWSDDVNSSLDDVVDVDIYDDNGTELSNNGSLVDLNQSFTVVLNLSDKLVEIENLVGNMTSWSHRFEVLNESADFESNVTTHLGTDPLDLVILKNFSYFANDSEVNYTGRVRLPKNSSHYTGIYYCSDEDDADSCVRLYACGSEPCFTDYNNYAEVVVPHFSSVFGANDTVAPNISISSPANASNLSSGYNVALSVSTNENSNCSWRIDSLSWNDFSQTNSTAFSATFSNYTNGQHVLYVNCTDEAGNSAIANSTFRINDTTAPSYSLSVSSDEDSISFSFTTDEPANHTISLEGKGSKKQTSFTLSHSASFSGLSSGTSYGYNVSVCDRVGNCANSSGSKSTSSSSSSSSGSSSSGSSSSSSSSSAPMPTSNPRKSQIFTDLTANSQRSMTVSDDEIDVTRISFTVLKNIPVARMIVEGLGTSRPTSSEPAGKVYQYIQITAEDFPAGSMSDIMISFRVSKSWVSSENIDESSIRLERYSGGWHPLLTSRTGEDSYYYYFQAETPGFSYFSIVGDVSSAEATPSEEGVPPENTSAASPVESPSEDQQTATSNVEPATPPSNEKPRPSGPAVVPAATPEEESSNVWIYALIVLVLAAISLGYYIYSDEIKTLLKLEKKIEKEVEEVKEEVRDEGKSDKLEDKPRSGRGASPPSSGSAEVVYELSGGTEVRNIHELLEALKDMDDETFMNYVNDSKNDFAEWVNNVFKDYELASKISDVRTREEMCRKIEAHLKSLKVSPEDEEARILESLRKHDLAVPTTDLSELRKFVHLSLSHGLSKQEIRAKLLKKDWPAEIVDILLSQIKPK